MPSFTINIPENNPKKKMSKKKKKQSQPQQKQGKSQEEILKKEISELEKKKMEAIKVAKKSAEGKGFLHKIGASTTGLAFNKAINEKRKVLKLLNQKKGLEARRDVTKLQREVAEEQGKLREQRKKAALREEDIFGTGNLFKI